MLKFGQMVTATFEYESKYWEQGLELICGVDEVGRGCFAGPVAAGAVIFKPGTKLPDNVRDSKLLTKQARAKLEEELKDAALAWSVAFVDVPVINKLGIGQAAQLAFVQAVKSLSIAPEFILVDAFLIKGLDPQMQLPIIRGDQVSASIAAASILAKVERDRRMEELDLQYPGYGFAVHKGYGTQKHQQAIAELGLSDLHRTSFKITKFQKYVK